MRIIAGKNRSLPLKTPKGYNTRPTTDRIKETLFNMISNQIHGCTFLDIFSGSGAIGLEAVSRGAKKVFFIENNKDALNCIHENIRFTKSEDECVVYKQDYLTALNLMAKDGVMDIIFMDPPYGQNYEKEVLKVLSNSPICSEDTLIIVEADLKTTFDDIVQYGFEVTKYKKYKTNAHIFIKKI